jgi:hypothetical protein
VSLAELDETRDRLRQAADAMTSALMAAEADPNRALLEQVPLTGQTAARWAEARSGLERLWVWFTHLQDLLARVDPVRGNRSRVDRTRLRELEDLLTGPSIQLTTDEAPATRPEGAAADADCVHYTAGELLDLMSTTLDEVRDLLRGAGSVWSDLPPRIDRMQSELADIEQRAESLGDSSRSDIESLRSRVLEMATSILGDPLAVDEQGVGELESAVHVVRDELEGVAVLRTHIDEELNQTRALLSEIELSLADCAEAQRQVKRKIVCADLPSPPRVDRSLGRQLNQIDALVGRGQWRAVARDLENLQRRTRAVLTDARRVAEESRAPIKARNELRGRLDAYRAKAQRVGRLEDPEVAGAYGRARRVLYTAPTDLVTATELVERYQDAVARAARSREVPR